MANLGEERHKKDVVNKDVSKAREHIDGAGGHPNSQGRTNAVNQNLSLSNLNVPKSTSHRGPREQEPSTSGQKGKRQLTKRQSTERGKITRLYRKLLSASKAFKFSLKTLITRKELTLKTRIILISCFNKLPLEAKIIIVLLH